MSEAWLDLLPCVLQPRRPRLAACLAERARHVEREKAAAATRSRALVGCEARIQTLRSEVFAASTGVVTQEMTALEREWRSLARRDPDGGLMNLWAAIAPPAWIDRKRWRDASAEERVDIALALASDVEGVEAAEHAARTFGTRVRWVPLGEDVDATSRLLDDALVLASEALTTHDGAANAFAHARTTEERVHRAALARFPERPLFARSIAFATFVDTLWTIAKVDEPNPVAALRTILRTGYIVAAVGGDLVTLAVPTSL